MALLVQADLGADPWTVFGQGVAHHTGPGPRDGLMTGLAALGVPIAVGWQ